MSSVRNGVSNILLFVFLVGLVVVVIAFFNSRGSYNAGPGSSPVPTAVGVQTSPLATPTGSMGSLAKIGAPVLIRSSSATGLQSGDQQNLLSVSRRGNQAYTTIFDLATGKERKIADIASLNARLSGRWLVYEDHPPVTSTVYFSRIKAVNLNSGKEILLGDENATQQSPSISGDIVVWADWRNREKTNVDIYGYDLLRGQEFPIVVKPGPNSGPKISGKWVVYVEPTAQSQHLAELRAHSLVTGEDFSIGIIPAPQDATNGTYYAIDSDEVAWTKVDPGSPSLSALHLYDLRTRLDRQLSKQTMGEPSSGLSISSRAGIVVCGCAGQGWTAFDTFQSPPVQLSVTKPMTSSTGGYQLSVLGDNLVWWVGLRPGTFESNIYIAPISR
jgi:beta propeller repeat protein